ncbi:hypothetical protein FXW07_18160 [Methanosarcina sp. DH1]|nr:hypothetical protein [Methanosarcina sp. DH1]
MEKAFDLKIKEVVAVVPSARITCQFCVDEYSRRALNQKQAEKRQTRENRLISHWTDQLQNISSCQSS